MTVSRKVRIALPISGGGGKDAWETLPLSAGVAGTSTSARRPAVGGQVSLPLGICSVYQGPPIRFPLLWNFNHMEYEN